MMPPNTVIAAAAMETPPGMPHREPAGPPDILGPLPAAGEVDAVPKQPPSPPGGIGTMGCGPKEPPRHAEDPPKPQI